MPIAPAIEQWLKTINTTWPAFQIEKDKKYILNNGEIIGPMIPTNDSDGFTWKFLRQGTKCHRYWNSKGIRWCVSSRPMENIKSEYIEDSIPIRELGCQADPEPVYEPWDFDTMPESVRIKSKECGTRWVVRPSSDGHCLRGANLTRYDDLYKHYVQLDGSPCGKVRQ